MRSHVRMSSYCHSKMTAGLSRRGAVRRPSSEVPLYVPPALRAMREGTTCPTCGTSRYRSFQPNAALGRGLATAFRHGPVHGAYSDLWLNASSGVLTPEEFVGLYPRSTQHQRRVAEESYNRAHPVTCLCHDRPSYWTAEASSSYGQTFDEDDFM